MTEQNQIEQDPELKAMFDVFAALKNLDSEAQVRVLEYVDRRLGLGRRYHSDVLGQERDTGSSDVVGNRQSQPSEATPKDRSNDDLDLESEPGTLEGISPIASKWMRRNDLSEAQLSELYSLGVDEIDLVAKKVPGSSARERLKHVMLLQGIASYLSSGVPRIENEKLRDAAKHYDADVGRNFGAFLKTCASEISGSRSEANLTLTTRGLNSAKDLIKQMAQRS